MNDYFRDTKEQLSNAQQAHTGEDCVVSDTYQLCKGVLEVHTISGLCAC